MAKRPLVLLFLLGTGCINVRADGIVPATIVDATHNSTDYSETLSGDWGGRRRAMSDAGYDWEIVYKLDVLGPVSPPGQKIYGLDNLDIKLSLDGEKIAGIEGSSALLYVLSNRGGKPVVQGDHSAGLDNIRTPEGANTTKLYQAWIRQNFLDGRLSVLAGLYDLNSEFYVTESSSMFIQPVYGIGAEMAGAGQNGPSIFPTASFGMRARAEDAGCYLQAAILDGVPGDPGNPHGTHVQFNSGDGALQVMEGAIPLSAAENVYDNKLALGAWRYTDRFDDLLDPAIKRISHGYYAIIDKVLRYKPSGDEPGISGFVRAGKTDGDTFQFDMSWSAGLVFSGPIAGREHDQLGIAMHRSATVKNGVSIPATRLFSNDPWNCPIAIRKGRGWYFSRWPSTWSTTAAILPPTRAGGWACAWNYPCSRLDGRSAQQRRRPISRTCR